MCLPVAQCSLFEDARSIDLRIACQGADARAAARGAPGRLEARPASRPLATDMAPLLRRTKALIAEQGVA